MTRPWAAASGTVSVSATGVTRSRRMRSTSSIGRSVPPKAKQSSESCAITQLPFNRSMILSENRRPLFGIMLNQPLDRHRFDHENVGDGLGVVERDHRQLDAVERRVGGD